ncbi:MAG TPA: HAMP domain-containing protein, partial [Nitrospirota bacterium]|nr:HAMP domain-containing protein [Nitrospirota bacterium]
MNIFRRAWNFFFYRMSIRTKIALMILSMSTVFGIGILTYITLEIQTTLRDESINKALILADGLSVKAADPVQVEDLNALQFLQGEAISQPDVAYCFVKDARGRVLSSSFEGNIIPQALKDINILQPNVPFGTAEAVITIRDSVVEVIDIASPIAGGALGTVHIGLNITQLKLNIRKMLAPIVYAGAGTLALLVIITLFVTYRIMSPVKGLMVVAEALGRGDLTKKTPITTGNELGLLGETLNNTIDRLQGLVQTESDRDKMQHQVMDLLTVVSTAAEGDLTIKAEVTADALGSVADAFNLMINGLTSLVAQAHNAAMEIQRATTEILHSSERMRQGAEQQTDQIRH